MAGAPAPGDTCRVCGDALEPGTLRCRSCGATYGERNRCPHCRSVTDVEPDPQLRFRCRVCGGPRVPLDDGAIARSGREVRALERTQRARVRSTAWRAGSAALGAFGLVSLVVGVLTLLAVSGGALATAGLLLGVSVPMLLAAWAWKRGGRHARERDTALDEAWELVASDVMSELGPELSAARLASVMRVDENDAETLLAGLSARDFVRARVTDAGEVLFRTESERLRIGPDSAGDEDAPEAEANAAPRHGRAQR